MGQFSVLSYLITTGIFYALQYYQFISVSDSILGISGVGVFFVVGLILALYEMLLDVGYGLFAIAISGSLDRSAAILVHAILYPAFKTATVYFLFWALALGGIVTSPTGSVAVIAATIFIVMRSIWFLIGLAQRALLEQQSSIILHIR